LVESPGALHSLLRGRKNASNFALIHRLAAELCGYNRWRAGVASCEHPATSSSEDFVSTVKRIRETWVQEFNAGNAGKVAALYAEEAVLMRRNGSVHNRDSIQAELERSITAARGHNYTLESLHAEHSGDLGYDTGDL
jgi:hypothetical protein